MYELPLKNVDFNQVGIFKALAKANRALGELKGYVSTLPNPEILINAITVNEAKDSSEIEQIVTTFDELYSELSSKQSNDPYAKEVANYRAALMTGYRYIAENNNFLTTKLLVKVQNTIEQNNMGIRTTAGTVIKNMTTGEIIHTPPQTKDEIQFYLKNLEEYMNIEDIDDLDPLIKLAIIHYQFESIHPFYDGNGRTGRILNVLYLVREQLIDAPIVYLSRYILETKDEYYRLLKEINHGEQGFIPWVEYFLKGIENTSGRTLQIAKDINSLMSDTKKLIEKSNVPYSKDLLDTLFYQFYVRPQNLVEQLGISMNTARDRLKKLEEAGILKSKKVGRELLYTNILLFDLIERAPEIKPEPAKILKIVPTFDGAELYLE
ncbi:Fic family protein [Enterococcus nangangensis]